MTIDLHFLLEIHCPLPLSDVAAVIAGVTLDKNAEFRLIVRPEERFIAERKFVALGRDNLGRTFEAGVTCI